MNEEQGFLDELRDHPEDDVTRLVYADWLEERGDPRAAYLSAEVALARMAEGSVGYAEAEAELSRLLESVEPNWIEQAGKRWDLVLIGYAPTHKIGVVKFVWETLSYSLLDAVNLIESVPTVIRVGASRSDAESARRRSRSSTPDALILVEIVPSPDPTKEHSRVNATPRLKGRIVGSP